MSLAPEPQSRRLAILRLLLGEHLTSRSRLDLLVFWGRYPCGWFDRRAIRPHTRCSREEIKGALDELVEEGVIMCRRDAAVPSYALTQAGGIRRAVQELPRLTPNERRYLLHLSTLRDGGSEDQPLDEPPPGILRRIIEGADA